MLTLGISSSWGKFAIVFGIENEVVYSSDNLKLSENKDIRKLIENGLSEINKKTQDISNIIVDNGPGGTSSVRTGVAFANSLAYSLKIGVSAVSSLEILGFDVYEKYQRPVICSINSTKGNVFLGFFNENELKTVKFGKIESIIPEIEYLADEFVTIGLQSSRIIELLKNKKIINSGLDSGNVDILIRKKDLFLKRIIRFPKYVIPITEDNYNL